MSLKGFKSRTADWCKQRVKEWPRPVWGVLGIVAAVVIEPVVQTGIAYYDPDFFGTTVEKVIESQNNNFSKVQSSIENLRAVTTDNAAAQEAIARLSQNLENTLASNNELTTKLKTVAEDRELLREELKKKKGGDLIPTIAIPEYKTIHYPDLGVLGLSEYKESSHSIVFKINDKNSRLEVGESVKITKPNGEVCRLVYRGIHENKHGVEKVCFENTGSN